MNNQINKPTLNIAVGDVKLKVIRVGQSPKLTAPAQPQKRIRHIHSHFTYEVFFITEGSLKIVTDDQQREYERSVVIIPPHIGHYTVPNGDGCFCLLFSLDEKHKNISEKFDGGIYKTQMSEDVEFYIKALSRKNDKSTATAEKDVELLATLIFNELLSLIDPDKNSKILSRAESKHIGAIETYINANFSKKITLTNVAEQVYLSTKQVSRIIKKEYDCTLSQLVTDKKLAAAKKLLKDTDMKIGEIALAVNLGAENYFYLLFKKKYNQTPLQYRKSQTTIKK